MLLENISCPVCENDEFRVIFKSKDFRFKNVKEIFNVVKCVSCGFIFLNPRLEKSQISGVYPLSFYEREDTLLFKLIEPFFRIAQNSTARLLKKYKKNGKALDIGCGSGNFVLVMQKYGYDAWGIEPNSIAEGTVVGSLKDHIWYKDIKECQFSPNSFDIITMFQSLEHIHGTKSLFEEIARILKNDGLLYICVPDAAFFEFELFGPYSYNLEVPRHLYFFKRKSIRDLLLKNGFMVDLFIRDSFFEYISTPASLYHGLWNLLEEKGILENDIIKSITYFPLILTKLVLRTMFFFQNQNLKALCHKI